MIVITSLFCCRWGSFSIHNVTQFKRTLGWDDLWLHVNLVEANEGLYLLKDTSICNNCSTSANRQTDCAFFKETLFRQEVTRATEVVKICRQMSRNVICKLRHAISVAEYYDVFLTLIRTLALSKIGIN